MNVIRLPLATTQVNSSSSVFFKSIGSYFIPGIQVLIEGLGDLILKAVPKKKTTHRKKV